MRLKKSKANRLVVIRPSNVGTHDDDPDGDDDDDDQFFVEPPTMMAGLVRGSMSRTWCDHCGRMAQPKTTASMKLRSSYDHRRWLYSGMILILSALSLQFQIQQQQHSQCNEYFVERSAVKNDTEIREKSLDILQRHFSTLDLGPMGQWIHLCFAGVYTAMVGSQHHHQQQQQMTTVMFYNSAPDPPPKSWSWFDLVVWLWQKWIYWLLRMEPTSVSIFRRYMTDRWFMSLSLSIMTHSGLGTDVGVQESFAEPQQQTFQLQLEQDHESQTKSSLQIRLRQDPPALQPQQAGNTNHVASIFLDSSSGPIRVQATNSNSAATVVRGPLTISFQPAGSSGDAGILTSLPSSLGTVIFQAHTNNDDHYPSRQTIYVDSRGANSSPPMMIVQQQHQHHHQQQQQQGNYHHGTNKFIFQFG